MVKFLTTTALVASATASFAGTKTFTIVGDKLAYRNVATVESTAEFETFTGKTNAVSGSIIFDIAKKTGSGTLIVDPASIDTGIPLRNDHMKSAGWLDTAKYGEIKFVTTSVKHTSGDNYAVTGKFTLHGVTKTIKTTATVRYRDAADSKAAGFTGDVVQVKTKFDIKIGDYGIKIPDMAKGKVAEDVSISISAYGLAK